MDLGTKAGVSEEISLNGYSWITASEYSMSPLYKHSSQELWTAWDDLEVDNYLQNGATFRLRRYGRFYLEVGTGEILVLPDAPYFQTEEDNNYAGGIDRKFACLNRRTAENKFLQALIYSDFQNFPLQQEEIYSSWEIGVHLFRIVTTDSELGLPTPEGPHHDGNDYFSVHLVGRNNIRGGATEIFNNDKRLLERRKLAEPMDTLLVRDPAVMHAVTPIHLEKHGVAGTRDALVIDFFHRPHLQRPAEIAGDHMPAY